MKAAAPTRYADTSTRDGSGASRLRDTDHDRTVVLPSLVMASPGSGPRDEVLFCTDTVADRHGDLFRATLPGLDIVPLADHVSEADLDRITLSFFSPDAYPQRSAAHMRVNLSAPNLRWLHSYSAGLDHPVFTMIADRGVVVTNSPGAAAPAIAETVMMYLLALSRRLPVWFEAQRRHEWQPHRFEELSGTHLVIVGLGAIGCAVARLAAAFDMRVTGIRRRVVGDEPCPTVDLAALDTALASADAVVVALALTDETRTIIDERRLGLLADHALFVNVGRGELVDEAALATRLRTGALGGAALDVFAREPLDPASPLWDADNVIITPHASGMSNAAERRAIPIFVEHLRRYRDGSLPDPRHR